MNLAILEGCRWWIGYTGCLHAYGLGWGGQEWGGMHESVLRDEPLENGTQYQEARVPRPSPQHT